MLREKLLQEDRQERVHLRFLDGIHVIVVSVISELHEALKWRDDRAIALRVEEIIDVNQDVL